MAPRPITHPHYPLVLDNKDACTHEAETIHCQAICDKIERCRLDLRSHRWWNKDKDLHPFQRFMDLLLKTEPGRFTQIGVFGIGTLENDVAEGTENGLDYPTSAKIDWPDDADPWAHLDRWCCERRVGGAWQQLAMAIELQSALRLHNGGDGPRLWFMDPSFTELDKQMLRRLPRAVVVDSYFDKDDNVHVNPAGTRVNRQTWRGPPPIARNTFLFAVRLPFNELYRLLWHIPGGGICNNLWRDWHKIDGIEAHPPEHKALVDAVRAVVGGNIKAREVDAPHLLHDWEVFEDMDFFTICPSAPAGPPCPLQPLHSPAAQKLTWKNDLEFQQNGWKKYAGFLSYERFCSRENPEFRRCGYELKKLQAFVEGDDELAPVASRWNGSKDEDDRAMWAWRSLVTEEDDM